MTKLINLPGVIVEDSQDAGSTLILSVRAESKIAICPRCGQKSYRLHQNKRHLVKDLPIWVHPGWHGNHLAVPTILSEKLSTTTANLFLAVLDFLV